MWDRKMLGMKVRVGLVEGIVLRDWKESFEIAVIRSGDDTVKSGRVYIYQKTEALWKMTKIGV